jgi:2'-5' RNA ligase
MQKRLFVAVTLPEEVERAISYEADAISAELPAELNARFSAQHKLHFTIIFLESQEEEGIPNMIDAMKKAVSHMKPFETRIIKTDYAPEGNSKRMVWAYGSSDGMEELKRRIEESFIAYGVWFPRTREKFSPHITLARFEPKDADTLPKIAGELDIKFEVSSVELVESEWPEGDEYKEVVSVDFEQKDR